MMELQKRGPRVELEYQLIVLGNVCELHLLHHLQVECVRHTSLKQWLII